MRREGYEMGINSPEVILKDGLEPYELVTIELDMQYTNGIIDQLNNRKGVLLSTENDKNDPDRQILTFKVPSRGLLGFRSRLTNDTRGTSLFRQEFMQYDEFAGPIKKTVKGAIISSTPGQTSAYALRDIEEKGRLFVQAGQPTYQGQVLGEYVLEG